MAQSGPNRQRDSPTSRMTASNASAVIRSARNPAAFLRIIPRQPTLGGAFRQWYRRTMLRPMPEPAGLAIVLPAYNEAERIGPALDELFNYLVSPEGATLPRPIDVLVVDDGST